MSSCFYIAAEKSKPLEKNGKLDYQAILDERNKILNDDSKEQTIESLILIYLSTTPSRQLAEGASLEYNKYVIVNDKVMKDIIDYYKNEISSDKQAIDDAKKEIETLKSTRAQASSVEVYDHINDIIDNIEGGVKEAEEDYEYMQQLYYQFLAVSNIIEDNKNDTTQYSFYYYYA